jgi:hypothetical protein
LNKKNTGKYFAKTIVIEKLMAIPTKDITSKKPEKDWKGCRKNWNMLRTQKNAEMKALIKI